MDAGRPFLKHMSFFRNFQKKCRICLTLRTSKTIIVVYHTGGVVKSNFIRAYKKGQNVFGKEIDTMRCLRILLISGFLALVLALAGCGSTQARNSEKPGVGAERMAWRPTGTGFYHPEIDY